MNQFSDIKQELQNLITKGKELHKKLSDYEEDKESFFEFIIGYEGWYSKALAVVTQLIPNRVEDFSLLYSNSKRKELMYSTYTISDALRIVANKSKNYNPLTAVTSFMRQIEILKACEETFDSKLYNLKGLLQADVFDSEIDSAKHLKKKGFYRAAGAICGVVMEKHFSEVCKNRGIVIKKKNPTIADYNDALKEDAYDIPEWRRIQRLGDIRNLCDHSKDREPTADEIEDLISGTEKVIKTIF